MAIAAAIAVTVAAVAGVAALLVNRARLAELQRTVAMASADAVTATDFAPFLDRLSAVRTTAFESLDATRSTRMTVVSFVRDEQEAEAERIRRVKARQRAAAEAASAAGSASGATDADSAGSTPRPSGGLVIGDSVSLGAESCLSPLGYQVDSEVGRQFSVGLDHLRVHAADGLPNTVVLHLGTNGPFSSDGFDQAMALTGSQRRVVWVTIALPPRAQYSFVDSLNDMIRAQAAQYDNVRVADFARAAAENPAWLASDGVHISGAGCDGFARTLDAAVTRP